MGGVGHLSRSLGLTLDHIEELRGVTAQGRSFRITADAEDQQLWTMLRGAAIFLAVITAATLRTRPRRRLIAVRQLRPLRELAEWISLAEALPPQAACSLILGFSADQQQPQLLSYAVAAEQDGAALKPLRRWAGTWTELVAGLEQLTPFELPNAAGSVPAPPAASPDRRQRPRSKVYSISLPRGLAAELMATLSEALLQAPGRDCRIDLQHVGGVVNEVGNEASAYRGRRAEWSVVITAVWPAGDQAAAAAAGRWADDCFDALAGLANHYYIVQRHPGTSRFAEELELAYGPLLKPLRQRKQEIDPMAMLPSLE